MINKFVKFIVVILILGMLSAVAGCASQMKIEVKAAPCINPDSRNLALPVVVRIFQLKTQQAFAAASFDSLWRNDQQALGASLIDKQDMTIMPKSTVVLKLLRKPTANYLGVMAIYRTRHGNSWRAIKRISTFAPFGHRYRVELINNRLSLH